MKAIFEGRLTEDRRSFLKEAGSLAAWSLIGLSIFSACEKENNSPESGASNQMEQPGSEDAITVSPSQVTIDLTKMPNLRSTGAWVLISEARLLVVNTGNNSWQALSSVCTHQGCSDSWNFANNVFICTCHNSRFRTDGSVEQGPATSPLKVYNNSLSNDILTITL